MIAIYNYEAMDCRMSGLALAYRVGLSASTPGDAGGCAHGQELTHINVDIFRF
jgi:hypothetical protein